MLNFLAQETKHDLQRASLLAQGRSLSGSPIRKQRSSSSSVAQRRPRTNQSHHSHHSHHSHQPLDFTSSTPEGFFPDLGLSWRDPRRKTGRNWLRRQKLNREQAHHQKILKVMANCVYEPKHKKKIDIWTDPTINDRALDWYRKEQDALANGHRIKTTPIKKVNWFVQMEMDKQPPKPKKVYVPPPPQPAPGPQHPRMLVPVPAVAAEPVAHISSSRAVMNAVARREHYYKLFERTMLMSRAKGAQYLGGPPKLLKKYFELFRHLLVETIAVGRAIEEWRYQLSLLTKKRVPYHKTAVASIRPAFMWGGETISNKGHKKRYYKNYILKMASDLQCLIKTEIPAKMGKGSEILINKANISGHYVQGIEVCPLLLPFSLKELLDPAMDTTPTQVGVGLPSESFYGCTVEDVHFIARLIMEERMHHDVQGKLFINPESVQGFESMVLNDQRKIINKHETRQKNMISRISTTSTFGPSIRAAVDAIGSVQLKVAKDLNTRNNSHMSRTFTTEY